MPGRPAFGDDYRTDYRALRRRGLTQAAAARRLGVSERTVRRWEQQLKAKRP